MARILSALICAYCFACISCSSEGGASPSDQSSSSAVNAGTNTGVVCTTKDSSFIDSALSVQYICDGSTWWGFNISLPSSSSTESAVVTSSSSEAGSSSSMYVHIPGFDPCRFNFGAGWQTAHADSSFYAGLDYISVWLGDNSYFNNGFEGKMLDVAMKTKATPMIYAYVIAEFDKDHGIVDCDVRATSNHCTNGAQMIRTYFADSILARYREYASGIADYITFYYSPEVVADTVETIWLIEPDFYQYSESGSEQNSSFDQEGGGIPDDSMGIYFSQIVQTIKTYLPSAKIAIDISPWIQDMKGWYANFDMSLVDYGSTSGGRTLAGSTKIRSANTSTWAEVRQIIGKPILADAGYDAGGKGTGQDTTWDNVTNLNARIADGIIGVTQMDAASSYSAVVSTVRPQLNAIPGCSSN